MAKYIYERENWTDFSWQDKVINAVFGRVRLMQGKIIGQMNALGFSAKETSTDTALRDIKDLVEKGILKQTDEGGRSASYELADF